MKINIEMYCCGIKGCMHFKDPNLVLSHTRRIETKALPHRSQGACKVKGTDGSYVGDGPVDNVQGVRKK